MKKLKNYSIFLITLIILLILGGIGIWDINKVDAIEIKNISVTSEAELKDAILNHNNPINIKIASDIVLTENLSIPSDKKDIKIEGNDNFKINLNELFFIEVKGENIELHNLNIENYKDVAIKIYRSENVKLKDINMNSNLSPKIGVSIDASKVSIDNIETNQHTQTAIRLLNSSTITVGEGNKFINEMIAIENDISDKSKVVGVENDSNFLDVDSSTYSNREVYYYLYEREVGTEAELIDSLNKYNIHIKLINDVALNDTYIDNKIFNKYTTNIKISSNNQYTISVNENLMYLTTRTLELENIKVDKYKLVTPIYLFNIYGYESNGKEVTGAVLNNIYFNGVDSEDEAKARSAIKIVASNVEFNTKLNSKIISRDHTEAVIDVGSIDNSMLRGAKVVLNGEFDSLGDILLLKGVEAKKHIASSETNRITIIDNAEEIYSTVPYDSYYESLGEVNIYRYAKQKQLSVSNSEEFLKAVKETTTQIVITNDIVLPENYIDDIEGAESTKVYVGEMNTITSDGSKTLDLNGNTLLIKNNNVSINNLIIKNGGGINSLGYETNAIELYNTNGVLLEDLNISRSSGYAISVNGSMGTFKNLTTEYNGTGGILITRSRSLYNPTGTRDSVVNVLGTMIHNENGVYVKIRNLELLEIDSEGKPIARPGNYSNNVYDITGLTSEKGYIDYETPKKMSLLSDFYLDLFGFEGDDRLIKYGSYDINYNLEKDLINVTDQMEVPVGWTSEMILKPESENVEYIKLDNTGEEDIKASLESLIAYAGNYGKELYFPQGTYYLSETINLTNLLGQKSLSNFGLLGDSEGLSIIKGKEVMTEIKSLGTGEGSEVDYEYPIYYFTSENMTYDNVAFGFKGPNKIGISFKNNGFINGTYKEEEDLITLNAYLDLENSFYTVTGNTFFRDINHAGKGVYLFATNDSIINDNFFGDLTYFNTGQKLDPVNMLTDETTGMIKKMLEGELIDYENNGNFFTGVNLVRRDMRVLIQNNYFDFEEEKDLVFPNGVSLTKPIYGLNDKNAPHRKDHVIYAKGFYDLNIVGNYFQGMENGGAGGVKIRNGEKSFIGSNYFNNTPLLTYVYADLSHDEILFEDIYIYNNIFNIQNNQNKPHSGILFYQSFKNGTEYTLNTSATNPEKITKIVELEPKNILLYKNKFYSENEFFITLNSNSIKYKDEFKLYGNIYVENAVDYIKTNNIVDEDLIEKYKFKDRHILYGEEFGGFDGVTIPENQMISLMNNSGVLDKYKDIKIPLEEQAEYRFFEEKVDEYIKVASELKVVFENLIKLKEHKSLTEEQIQEGINLLEERLVLIQRAKAYQEEDVNFENNQADINLYTRDISLEIEKITDYLEDINNQNPEMPEDENDTESELPEDENTNDNESELPEDEDDNESELPDLEEDKLPGLSDVLDPEEPEEDSDITEESEEVESDILEGEEGEEESNEESWLDKLNPATGDIKIIDYIMLAVVTLIAIVYIDISKIKS